MWWMLILIAVCIRERAYVCELFCRYRSQRVYRNDIAVYFFSTIEYV